MSNLLAPLAALSLVMLVSACATAGTDPTATPRVTDSPSLSPSATPSADPTAQPTDAPTEQPTDGVVVTLRNGEEEFRLLLTDPDDIEIARGLLSGEEERPLFPIGPVVRGDPGVNTGYDWHIDPDEVEWVEIAMELCDGLPSDVSGAWESDVYCPWDAQVVAVEEVN